MSTPNEYPGPEQPGSQPPPPGYGAQPGPAAPPPGYQGPPPGYQTPPPGYQPPGYQGPPQHQQQGQQPPGSDFKFEMPHDMPRSLNQVMPVGGFSGIFKTAGLPQLLKISYIIWLVTAGLWLFFTLLAFLGSLLLLATNTFRGEGVKGIVLSIVSVALAAAVVVCAMKLKEGMQWARMALSAIVVLGFILVFFGAPGGGLLGVVAAVLMWLPESNAWFNSRSRA